MTRFDADDPENRRKLFAEGIEAHRERSGPYLTVEAHPPDGDEEDPLASTPDPDDIREEADESERVTDAPWVQFSEGTFNLDCTDEELDRLKDLLDDYPSFRVDDLTSPEQAEGTNVRITARADANRLAGFVERAFREVYDSPEGYRGWVVEI